MSVTCDYVCDLCGDIEEDAGLNGPDDWIVDANRQDVCGECQEQAAASERRGASEEGE